MKVVSVVFVLLSFYPCLKAQIVNEDADKKMEEVLENLAEKSEEDIPEDFPDGLQSLLRNPLHVNKDNLDVLISVGLLTSTQVIALNEYKVKMGDLVELQELQMVTGFDKETILRILPYITINRLPKKEILHSMTFRYQRLLERQTEIYPGSPDKLLIRFRSIISSFLSFSFTCEKDAGEKYFSRNRFGFDFNSMNIMYNGNGLVRKIIAGDFNIEFCQGLTAWTGISITGGASISGIYKYGRGIIPYSGTDENRFLRGIAVNLKKDNISLDTWFSYHAIDGTLIHDTGEVQNYITSFLTSGYHRTPSEISNRHAVVETACGTALKLSKDKFSVTALVSLQHFSHNISPLDKPYLHYRFTGKHNMHVGTGYHYEFKNIFLFGEISKTADDAYAVLHGIIVSADSKLSIGLLHRHYSKAFKGLQSNAFGINSDNSNEKGTYIGINYKLSRKLIYAAYFDLFEFPFPKYRIDLPSHGRDQSHQLDYIPTKKFTASFRIKSRLRQANNSDNTGKINTLSDLELLGYRLSARFKIENGLEYGLRIEYSAEKSDNRKTSTGSTISQDLFYHPLGKKYSFNFRYAVFNCPEFNTRIYAYENDVQGVYSIPFYYGNGSRFYTNISWKPFRRFTLQLRYAISWIENRDGEKSIKSEIKIQSKISFR